jgi:hypothetical protein
MTLSFTVSGLEACSMKGTHTIAGLVTALVSSLIAMGGTIILDMIADKMENTTGQQRDGTRESLTQRIPILEARDSTPILEREVRAATRGFIGVFGLLLGLGWEEVFEHGNKHLTEWIDKEIVVRTPIHTHHPVLYQIALTSFVLWALIPSWAKHVIPRTNMTKEEHKNAMEAEETHEHATKSALLHPAQRAQLRARFFCCCRPDHPDAAGYFGQEVSEHPDAEHPDAAGCFAQVSEHPDAEHLDVAGYSAQEESADVLTPGENRNDGRNFICGA